MKAWRSKHFRELQRAYYEILKMEGFEDIEYGRDTDSTRYMQDDGTRYRLGVDHADLYLGAAAAEQADAANEQEDLFRDPFEARCWELWTGGYSMDDVAVEMGCSKKRVWSRIQAVKKRLEADQAWEKLMQLRRRLNGTNTD